MHTQLKITVEPLETDGGAETFIVESHGHRSGGRRCVCDSPEKVKATIGDIVDGWVAHNAELDGAETGAQIERAAVVG